MVLGGRLIEGLLLLEHLLFLQEVVARDEASSCYILLGDVKGAVDVVSESIGGDGVAALSLFFAKASGSGFVAGVSQSCLWAGGEGWR